MGWGWRGGGKGYEGVLYGAFLFRKPNNMHRVIDSIEPKVREDMNNTLLQLYTKAEIVKALKQMHRTKTAGPTVCLLFSFKIMAYISYFFCWNFSCAFNFGFDPSYINYTFIVLVLNLKCPKSPKDFRPISLCNVVVRVITKVISNCLNMCSNLWSPRTKVPLS